MACLKHVRLEAAGYMPVKAPKRYRVLRLLKHRPGSFADTYRAVKWDRPSPGFADKVMRRLK
jgi:hypothetical protein